MDRNWQRQWGIDPSQSDPVFVTPITTIELQACRTTGPTVTFQTPLTWVWWTDWATIGWTAARTGRWRPARRPRRRRRPTSCCWTTGTRTVARAVTIWLVRNCWRTSGSGSGWTRRSRNRRRPRRTSTSAAGACSAAGQCRPVGRTRPRTAGNTRTVPKAPANPRNRRPLSCTPSRRPPVFSSCTRRRPWRFAYRHRCRRHPVTAHLRCRVSSSVPHNVAAAGHHYLRKTSRRRWNKRDPDKTVGF